MVHFGEWTTSSVRNPGKGRETGGKPGASGPLRRVDHWLGQKPGKRAENWEKVRSQWSTLESGPLARPETGKSAENRGKARSQWSTPSSGPLAGAEAEEKARKLEKSQKLHPTKKRPAMPVAFDLFSR